jgi:hypothetical protein
MPSRVALFEMATSASGTYVESKNVSCSLKGAAPSSLILRSPPLGAASDVARPQQDSDQTGKKKIDRRTKFTPLA